MLDDFPLQRLSDVGPLSERELALLAAAVGPPVRLPHQTVIRQQGAAPDSIYLLQNGWACSAVMLPGGERQIMKIHLPGDFMGVPSLCLTQSADSLHALTPVVVRTFIIDRLKDGVARSHGIVSHQDIIAARHQCFMNFICG